MIMEPYASTLSCWLYRNLHHEPFVTDAALWELPAGGPMSSANGALPWSIFVRDRELFENEFSSLRIESVVPHTVYMYIVSGGVSMISLAPAFAFKALLKLERALGPLYRHLASMMTVELVREKSDR